MIEPGLGRVVARYVADGTERQERGNIDDPATSPQLDPARGGLARHQPCALQVGVEHAIPILLAVLEERLRDRDAGIVDENVERPERALGLLHAVPDALAARNI